MNASLNSWQHNLRIFWALLRRDLYILRTAKLRNLVIDTLIVTCTSYIEFAGLFPFMGVPQAKVPSIFLGSIIGMIVFQRGFSFAMEIVYNIPYKGFGITEYHLTLPIQKRWLFAEYIAAFMIEAFILSFPIIFFGMYFIYPTGLAVAGNWFVFLFMYFFVLLFFGTFFLSCAFIYSHEWFKENMWQRRLSWMFCLGPIFFSWGALYKLSPIFANIMLLNPTTPVMEGIRSSLLAQSALSTPVCLLGLIIWIGINTVRLTRGIKNQLDPV